MSVTRSQKERFVVSGGAKPPPLTSQLFSAHNMDQYQETPETGVSTFKSPVHYTDNSQHLRNTLPSKPARLPFPPTVPPALVSGPPTHVKTFT
jgi:hypothetical protein